MWRVVSVCQTTEFCYTGVERELVLILEVPEPALVSATADVKTAFTRAPSLTGHKPCPRLSSFTLSPSVLTTVVMVHDQRMY